MRSEHVGMPYRMPEYAREKISFNVGTDGEVYLEQCYAGMSVRHTRCGNVRTIISDTDHVAGLLTAPALPEPAQENTPDLASALFGMNVQDAPEPEPESTPQSVMFTYKSGKIKHELRAGATIVKMGRTYYNLNGRKISAIFTDDTCKRVVPEKYYSRLFNVSEDPTLFA